MTGGLVATFDPERLADGLWRRFRPGLIALLDEVLAESASTELAGDELSPNDRDRAAAWVARWRVRDRGRPSGRKKTGSKAHGQARR